MSAKKIINVIENKLLGSALESSCKGKRRPKPQYIEDQRNMAGGVPEICERSALRTRAVAMIRDDKVWAASCQRTLARAGNYGTAAQARQEERCFGRDARQLD